MVSMLALLVPLFAGAPLDVPAGASVPPATSSLVDAAPAAAATPTPAPTPNTTAPTTLGEAADVVAIVTVRSVVVDVREGVPVRSIVLRVDEAMAGTAADQPLTLVEETVGGDTDAGPVAGQRLLLFARKGPDGVLLPLARTILVPVARR